MAQVVDFFFSPYPSAQARRLRAAIDDGLAHGSRIEPHDPTPDDSVRLLFSSNIRRPLEQVAVYYTTDGTIPQGEKGVATHGCVVTAQKGERIDDTPYDQPIQQWYAVLPAQADGTMVRYIADGWNSHDTHLHCYADAVDPVSVPPQRGRIFAYHVDRWTTPRWWRDAIVYQIFVDRFSSASDEPLLLEHGAARITDFFGGTLRGIIEKLDYIQHLGANCIWLSPLFESPTHHGYNASDYYTVAKRYGTNETLRQLIQEAHRRRMRVMLDFVANHTSNDHPAFIVALQNAAQETRSWYAFGDGATQEYRSYAAVTNMPELVTENPAVQRYLFDAALHWLGDFGADGLRLDYVPGPPHAFWTLFQREIKEHFPQALTIGEITAPLPEIAEYAGRMDAYMDFPLTHMLRNTFARRTTSLQELLTFIEQRRTQLPPSMSRGTLLDNHDMHRFLWLAQHDITRLMLAATCHLTLDGTPIIYYGTEVGLSQYEDAYKENAYARAPLFWDERQNTHLLAHYRHLLALRATHAALRYGDILLLPLQIISAHSDEDTQQVGAYARCLDGECFVIAINNSETDLSVHIALQEHRSAINTASSTLRMVLPVLENENTTLAMVDGGVTRTLPALSAVVLRTEQ